MNATLINCIIALLFTLSKSPFLPLWLGCSLYQEHRSRARCVRSLIMTLKHEVALLLWAHTAMKFPSSSLPHCIPFWSNVFVYILAQRTNTDTSTSTIMIYTLLPTWSLPLSHSHSHQRLTFTWRRLILTFAQFCRSTVFCSQLLPHFASFCCVRWERFSDLSSIIAMKYDAISDLT